MEAHHPADPERASSAEVLMKLVVWRSGRFWVGHLLDFPDYLTQGETLEELEENLRDLYRGLTSEEIQRVQEVEGPAPYPQALAEFLSDWQAEHGAITSEELARARTELGFPTR